MENIGLKLKEARTNCKLTLEEVHKRTKISLNNLQRLEDNDFDFLPETYVRSFLSDYAKVVGLDLEEVLQPYKVHLTEKKEHDACEQENNTNRSVFPGRLLEWSLGIGTTIVLFSMLILYFQYRAQIYASPNSSEQNAVLAQAPDTISVKLVAYDEVAVVIVEEETVNEFLLVPEQDLSWESERPFNVLVNNAAGIQLSFAGQKYDNLGASNQRMIFSFNKNGAFEKKPISEQYDPVLSSK